MKTQILAATLASASLAFVAPLHASSLSPVLTLEEMMDQSFDRRGRGCDTPEDIAEKPRCAL